jgi:hypothetical protein
MAALVCLCGGEASGSRNSRAREAQCAVPTGATRLHDSASGSLARSHYNRLFTFAVSGLVGTFSNAVLVLGLLVGVGLVWFSAPAVNQATERIDPALFRSAYDARQLLESLVGETRTVTSREELAALLGGEIKQALHPVFAAVYLGDRDGQLLVYPNAPATGFPPLPSRMALLEELARRNEPWQISDIDTREGGLLDDLAIFAANQPECLVPMLMRGGTLARSLAARRTTLRGGLLAQR